MIKFKPALAVAAIVGIVGVAWPCGNDDNYIPGQHSETKKCDPNKGTKCSGYENCLDNPGTSAIDCACR